MKTTKLNIGGVTISIENSDPTSTSNKSPVLAKSSEEYLICATEAITLANVTSAVLQDMNNDNSMSREGFGEKAKAVAKKTIEAIISFFKKIIEWCKNLIGFISQKIKSKFYEVEMNKIFKSVTKEQWDATVNELKSRNIRLNGVIVIDEQDRKKILDELKKLIGLTNNISNSWKDRTRNEHSTEFEKFKKHWELLRFKHQQRKDDIPVADILKNIRYGDTRMFNTEYEKLASLCNVLKDMNEMNQMARDNVIEIQKNNVDIDADEAEAMKDFEKILKTNVCPAINFMSNVANELFKQELIIINNKLKAAKMVVTVVKSKDNNGKESVLSNIDSVWDNL